MSNTEDISIHFDELKKETDGAYLISVGEDTFWLPKSQVRLYEKSSKVYVPEWMAVEKGLI